MVRNSMKVIVVLGMSFLLMAAEGDTESNFEPVRHYYHALLERLGWKDCGIVYAGGNMHVGDIAGKPQLEEAEALGASIR